MNAAFVLKQRILSVAEQAYYNFVDA